MRNGFFYRILTFAKIFLMKVLVTGGAGYKGIRLSKALLDKGYEVSILDNFMYGFHPILQLAEYPKLTVIKQDIRNKISDLTKFDAVFHLAGISGFPACAANPASAQQINIEATRQLTEGLSKNQILINASTTSFYGKSGDKCTEDTPINPVSHYGVTKYEAEKIVLQKENSLSFRFATVFGFSVKLRMDLMVNDFAYKALKEGVVILFDSYAKRTFIHIDDAVDCYIFGLENFDALKDDKVFNAGGDNLNFSKLEIAEAIKQHVEYNIIDSEIKDKDLRHFVVSYDKIKKKGFIPKRTLDEGIVQLLKVFKYYDSNLPYNII